MVNKLDSKAVADQIDFAQHIAEAAQAHSNQNRILINAVMWVTAIGFIALLVTVGAMIQNYLAMRTGEYINLNDNIKEQNTKLDLLFEQSNLGIKVVKPIEQKPVNTK